MIMDIYWSAVQILQNIPVLMVDATMLAVRCTMRKKSCVIALSIPQPDITPPKHIAQSISHIVLSIPSMPRVAIRLSTISTPDERFVLVVQMFIKPLKIQRLSLPPIACKISL